MPQVAQVVAKEKEAKDCASDDASLRKNDKPVDVSKGCCTWVLELGHLQALQSLESLDRA